MAVYERGYSNYNGALTPAWSRFLLIPKHEFQDLFKSKLFLSYFAICFVYPLVCMILIYLHHNSSALEILELDVADLIKINDRFFYRYTVTQGMLSFILMVMAGPTLVAKDLANNGLPLYLCRPFSRFEYVLGKLSVLLILLSAVTWIPGILLFVLQVYLEGSSWLASNLFIGKGIIVGLGVWVVALSMLALSVSAWVKWKVAAMASLVGLFIIPQIFAGIVNSTFNTQYGNIFNLRALIRTIWASLLHQPRYMELPMGWAWFGVVVICLLSLWMLTRKVKAYEVIN